MGLLMVALLVGPLVELKLVEKLVLKDDWWEEMMAHEDLQAFYLYISHFRYSH